MDKETDPRDIRIDELETLSQRFQQELAQRQQIEEELNYVITGVHCLLWHSHVELRKSDFHWQTVGTTMRGLQEFLPFDVAPGETMDESWYRHIPADDRQSMERDYEEALRQGRPGYQHEFRFCDRSGQIHWLHEDVQVRPLGVDSWDLVGLITDITEYKLATQALRDARSELENRVAERTAELARANDELRREVAERRRSEAALSKAKQDAETANQAKSVFLANMSHELRTPLNAILGYAQMLRRRGQVSREAGSSLETIHSSGEHLLELINSILDMSRIESGQTVVEMSDFDLHDLLLKLDQMFHLRAAERGLILTFQTDDAVPRFVRADEGKLRQILINLLGNAVKFTAQGSVTLRAGGVDGHLQAEVEDTGPGISEDELDTVFEAFVQTQSGRQTPGSTGLGLAISRQYAQIMDGSLDARSQIGVGSVFTLRLPVQPIDAIDSPGEERRVVGLQPGHQDLRVLIADDVEANRRLLLSLLAPLGLQMREVVDGQEAVQVCQDWRPHLVWMDMRMPIVDGYEATRRIKSMEGDLPVVVALTASAFEEDRERVMASGCDDFLRKPLREEEIFSAMERHLSLRFVYEEAEPTVAGHAGEGAGTVDLAHLPAAWRRQLHEAASNADDVALLALLDALEGDDVEAARGLRALATDFRWNEIMLLTEP